MSKKGISTLAKRICKQCGIEFMGGPRAWYCPACRYERQKERDRLCKIRQRQGLTRQLGSIDYCVVCGKPYIVEGSNQKYCPKCAPEAIKKVDNEQSKEWNREHFVGEYLIERYKKKVKLWHTNKKTKICPMCGKEYVPTIKHRQQCSDKCIDASKRYSYAKYNYNVGRRKRKPKLSDYQKGGRLYEQTALKKLKV